MKSILGLVQGSPCKVDIEFRDADGKPYKKTAVVKGKNNETEELPLFTNKDNIVGEVKVTPLTTKRIEHQSIKVQLLGQIELASERGHPHDFVSLARELAPPGDLTGPKSFPFEFRNVEMQYDSYRGQQVRCRYLLRVTVTGKGMTTADTKKEFPIWVRNYDKPQEAAAPIKMEVGIEDCLHIEFEYDRSRYHLKDVVVGRIYFLLVRIKLKYMEVEIRRRETTGVGSAAHNESETLAKYEIMDGAPVRGESIPIRLYLSPYELTPTYKEVHNKFSVRYFLNLVLVDEEDRRYFKQQEITLFRKEDDPPGTLPGSSSTPRFITPPSRPTGAGALSPQASMGGAPTSPSAAAAAPTASPGAPEVSEIIPPLAAVGSGLGAGLGGPPLSVPVSSPSAAMPPPPPLQPPQPSSPTPAPAPIAVPAPAAPAPAPAAPVPAPAPEPLVPAATAPAPPALEAATAAEPAVPASTSDAVGGLSFGTIDDDEAAAAPATATPDATATSPASDALDSIPLDGEAPSAGGAAAAGDLLTSESQVEEGAEGKDA